MSNKDDEEEDKRILALLTPEQRERLERQSRGESVPGRILDLDAEEEKLRQRRILSSNLNEIDLMEQEITKLFPAAFFERDNPVKPDGCWFLDVRLNERFVVVQWFSWLKQWGVSDGSDPDPLYTHQANKAFNTSAEALTEVARLLTK